MPGDFIFKNVAVYGLGLLGGSLCMALRKAAPGTAISAWGRSAERLRPALDGGIVDRAGSMEEADLAGADLVVVSTPVAASIDIILNILDRKDLGEHALVIDVGSVKEKIVDGVVSHSRARSFVGCHPMAGSEKTGFRNGRADLYEGSAVIITPHGKNEKSDVEKVDRFWKALGARTVFTGASLHDALVARTSHLPHMVSCVLVEQLTAGRGDTAGMVNDFIGRGFRDMTRIAAGSEEIWGEISLLNSRNITAAIDDFIDRLASLRDMIGRAGTEPEKLNEYLARVRKSREEIAP